MIQELENLKINLEHETRIIARMKFINVQLQDASPEERKFHLDSLNAFKEQLKILNDAIVPLLEKFSAVKKLPSVKHAKPKLKPKPKVVQISYVPPATKERKFVTVKKEDVEKFVKELSLSESALGRLKKMEKKKGKIQVSKASELARISNQIFGKIAEKIAPQFKDVKEDLKKANIRFMISTYVAMALFVSSLVFVLSLLAVILVMLINISFLMWIWVPFVLFGLSLTGFYFYPSLEKGSVEKKITDELPFSTIYMAAIAGSNIEPVKLFKIISLSPDYPNVGLEIKKLIVQIEVYGYDLLTALKNAATRTSNKKLAELFSGLASNIVSGGSLKNYLEKKADNLLLDYKLERQRYTALAGTFMDVYISILVAAPLVLMMMFIVMNVTGLGLGLSMGSILALAIGGITLVNILFLIVFHLKQPGA